MAQLAASQHGVATRQQLLAEGLTRHQIHGRAAAGLLIRMHQGVYRLAGAEETYEQRVMAACLASGGVASYRCAAKLFRLRGCCGHELVEITVEDPRPPTVKGAIVHRTVPGRLERTAIGVIPVTIPGRIPVDLAMVAPRLVGGALADLLVRVTTLRSVTAAVMAAGKTPGIGLVRHELEGYLAGQRPGSRSRCGSSSRRGTRAGGSTSPGPKPGCSSSSTGGSGTAVRPIVSGTA